MERNAVHHVKQKIKEVRHKQKIAAYIISVSVALLVVGYMLVLINPTIMFGGWIIILGFLMSLLGGWIWFYFLVQKSRTIKEFKTFLAMKQLNTRKQEEWELIQELLSS